MINYLQPKDEYSPIKRYNSFFTGTFLFVLLATVVSMLLFPLRSGLLSVFFASFSIIPAMETILEKNKNDIWQKRTTPFLANLDMAVSLTVIFCAAMFAYIVVVLIVPDHLIIKTFFSQVHDTMTHTHIVDTEFQAILIKRLLAAGVFFLVALFFRIGGVFVLVWLASVWGIIYGMYIKHGFSLEVPAIKHYMVVLGLTGFCVLLVRTLSFITASMAGVFLSKALSKYKITSKEFRQVFLAVLAILGVTALVLLLAVFFEYKIYS
ncbi:MAG: hypothetical protein ABII18_00760 [bacterium]|nr:hypothetical protein [bacterium]MBU1917312.1 hypothetical protein [bacterium]